MEVFDIEKSFKKNNAVRDAFLSRLLGIFSEDIVRIWCCDLRSPYKNIGRPSFFSSDDKYLHTTLDFCLVDEDGKKYISEMKCEIQYENYKYLTLSSVKHLNHHKIKKAFNRFLEVTEDPKKSDSKYIIKIESERKSIDGGILVWGKVDKSKKDEIIEFYKFADILSLEDIVNDLILWENEDLKSFVIERTRWCLELFEGIRGNS